MDLTEAEDIKKRWQKYTEELCIKDLNDPDNLDGVITHLEPDILECEVKWALGSITTNKASGGVPAELFQILKDDAVKVLHSICQQIWKTQLWPQGKISITSDTQMTPPLLQRAKKSWGASWWKWKRRVKKIWFKTQHSKNKDHGIRSHHFMANRWENSGNSDRLYFGGLQNHCRWWLQPWNQKMLAPWKKSYDQSRQHIKKQRHYFVDTGPSGQSYGFQYSLWMWELDYKESWALKNCSYWTVVLEKTLESPLDCKKIKPVSPKENQSRIFIGRTDAEAETPILWPPNAKNWLIRKDPDAGQDWKQEEKGTTEDEMVGWHHRLDGHEFEQAMGAGDGQGGLAGCSPQSRKRLSDWTEFRIKRLHYLVKLWNREWIAR